jgi:hypothetical protein
MACVRSCRVPCLYLVPGCAAEQQCAGCWWLLSGCIWQAQHCLCAYDAQ